MGIGNRPSIRFKTVIPKKGFLYDVFEAQVRQAMENYARPEIRSLFYETVKTWEHKVYFRGTIRAVKGKYIRLMVKPYGSNTWLYELVARGARRHPIPAQPKNRGSLVFLDKYVPATEPRWIGSGRAMRFGDVTFRKQVDHPGFEGRYWDEEIAKTYADRFTYLMEKAVYRYSQIQAREFKKSQHTETPQPVERT